MSAINHTGSSGPHGWLRRPVESWEAVLSGGMALILTASAIFPPNQLPLLPPVCHFKRVTGLPCPGCGLTRSFCAISHGHLADAWHYNPFGMPLYALTVFFLAFPLLNRRWPGLGRALQEWKVAAWFPATLVGIMWIWGLWRIWTRMGSGPG